MLSLSIRYLTPGCQYTNTLIRFQVTLGNTYPENLRKILPKKIKMSLQLPEDLKKVYLIIYNLFQFVGYTYILAVMSVRYAKLEHESIADTYEHVGPAMKFLQLMMYLEVMHPMFGYTKVCVNLLTYN